MLLHGTGCAAWKISWSRNSLCFNKSQDLYRASRNLTWDPILPKLNKFSPS